MSTSTTVAPQAVRARARAAWRPLAAFALRKLGGMVAVTVVVVIAAFMLVRTVTAMTSGGVRPSRAAVSRAASRAACIMRVPPAACTFTIQTPSEVAAPTAVATTFMGSSRLPNGVEGDFWSDSEVGETWPFVRP